MYPKPMCSPVKSVTEYKVISSFNLKSNISIKYLFDINWTVPQTLGSVKVENGDSINCRYIFNLCRAILMHLYVYKQSLSLCLSLSVSPMHKHTHTYTIISKHDNCFIQYRLVRKPIREKFTV